MSGKPTDGAGEVDAIRDAVTKLAKGKARAPAEVRDQPATDPADTTPSETVARKGPDPERLADAMRRAEAVLFASAEPIDAKTLAAALPPGVEPGDVLVRLKDNYKGKGVQLVEVAGKWRFQTAPDLAFLFEETREQQRPLSKAALETMAIVAYCQPVTRAEIEEVRGVQVSKGTLDVLMEVGWIRPRGRRRTPGRPITYGTTEAFLLHFGLDAIDSLPGKEELKGAGLLSAEIPAGFEFAGPIRNPMTGEIEDELPLDDPEFQADFLEGAEERE
jgi:segregation and condensation protein B